MGQHDIFHYETEIDRLLGEIEAIEAQLADRKKKRKDGRPMSGSQYVAWRKGAIKAMNVKLSELRETKRKLKGAKLRRIADQFDVRPDDHTAIIGVLTSSLRRLAQDYGMEDVSPDIMDALELGERYLSTPAKRQKKEDNNEFRPDGRKKRQRIRR